MVIHHRTQAGFFARTESNPLVNFLSPFQPGNCFSQKGLANPALAAPEATLGELPPACLALKSLSFIQKEMHAIFTEI
jgi:hypothetical protein